MHHRAVPLPLSRRRNRPRRRAARRGPVRARLRPLAGVRRVAWLRLPRLPSRRKYASAPWRQSGRRPEPCTCHAGRQIPRGLWGKVRPMTHAILLALAAAVTPGQTAPAFSLETTSGKKTLDDYKGQTLVLAFFSKGVTGGGTEGEEGVWLGADW